MVDSSNTPWNEASRAVSLAARARRGSRAAASHVRSARRVWSAGTKAERQGNRPPTRVRATGTARGWTDPILPARPSAAPTLTNISGSATGPRASAKRGDAVLVAELLPSVAGNRLDRRQREQASALWQPHAAQRLSLADIKKDSAGGATCPPRCAHWRRRRPGRARAIRRSSSLERWRTGPRRKFRTSNRSGRSCQRNQQRSKKAAGAALAAKRGETSPSKLKEASGS